MRTSPSLDAHIAPQAHLTAIVIALALNRFGGGGVALRGVPQQHRFFKTQRLGVRVMAHFHGLQTRTGLAVSLELLQHHTAHGVVRLMARGQLLRGCFALWGVAQQAVGQKSQRTHQQDWQIQNQPVAQVQAQMDRFLSGSTQGLGAIHTWLQMRNCRT